MFQCATGNQKTFSLISQLQRCVSKCALGSVINSCTCRNAGKYLSRELTLSQNTPNGKKRRQGIRTRKGTATHGTRRLASFRGKYRGFKQTTKPTNHKQKADKKHAHTNTPKQEKTRQLNRKDKLRQPY